VPENAQERGENHMLKLENISLTFGEGTVREKRLFNKFNFSVAKGEFVAVVGGNGAGKSSLFNVIAGNIIPNDGYVKIDDIDVTAVSECERSQLISRVMQDPKVGTMENMTIEENMSFAYMRGKKRSLRLFSSKSRIEFFREKISMLKMGLENRLDELVGNLSGGQRQAISMVMSVLADSSLLLLDEITAALDPKTGRNIMKIISEIAKDKATIMITHNMEHQKYATRTLEMINGKLMAFSQN
jgi:putative ABC transport system ATP-binding protein